MNESLALLLAGMAGLALGAIFFGGLWWTVDKCIGSERAGLWFFASLLLRMSVTLAGFFFVGRALWQSLLMCLLGFLVARFIVTWLTRSSRTLPGSPTNGARHAP